MDRTSEVSRAMTILSEWLIESCAKPGFSDMHIDRFNTNWVDRSRWVEGAISILHDAGWNLRLKDCNYKLAMVFTLQSGINPLGIDFGTREEFQKQLDYSPPSVFIAEPGSEPWITSQMYDTVRTIAVPAGIIKAVFSLCFECEALLMQYTPTEGQETSRTLWLIPKA